MSEKWEIFEDNVCKFLENSIKINGINFIPGGKNNSWESDIYVRYDDETLFLVESKLSPSQSGQFVILLKNGLYKYSALNKNIISDASKKIIEYINENISKYKNCGTAGVDINLPEKLFADWIKKHYKNKDVKFIITSDKFDNFLNNFIKIIPLEDFDSNFKITATLRCKRSGTQHIRWKHFNNVTTELKKKFGNNFILTKDGKVTIKGISEKGIYLGEYYYLSRKGNYYIVKIRSQTNNPNVIFSLKYIGEKRTSGFDFLEQEIRKLINSS